MPHVAPSRNIIIALAACLAIASLHALYYYPFLADDALISIRYADRFLHGHGLTWNDHEYVEGYTNLLWVLGTSFLGLSGIDLITAVRILGLLSAFTIYLALYHYVLRIVPASLQLFAFVFTGMFIALSPPVAAWTVGGLENIMLAAFLAVAMSRLLLFISDNHQHYTPLYVTGIILGLLVLTRADAPILVIGITIGLFLFNHRNFKTRLLHAFIIATIPFCFFLAQLTFRLVYYHDFLPNTYWAKFALTGQRFLGGFSYLAQFFMPFLFLILVSFLSCTIASLLKKHQKTIFDPSDGIPYFLKHRIGMTLIVLLCYSGYILVSGGDIFPAFRHGVVIIVLMAFTLIDVINYLWHHIPKRYFIYTTLPLSFSLIGYVSIACSQPENHKAKLERWEWDCKTIATEIHKKWGKYHPVIAVTTAGCLPYFTQFSAIDMLGLNDKYLARQRPENFGHGTMGHELMNASYVLSRKPEIITFEIASDTSIWEDFKTDEFFKNYTLYRFSIPHSPLVGHVWLRHDFLGHLPANASP